MKNHENQNFVIRDTRFGRTDTAQTSRVVECELRQTDLFGIFRRKKTDNLRLAPTESVPLYNGQFLVVAPLNNPDDPLILHVCEKEAIHGGTGRWHADKYHSLSHRVLSEKEATVMTSIGLLHGNVEVRAAIKNRGISVK